MILANRGAKHEGERSMLLLRQGVILCKLWDSSIQMVWQSWCIIPANFFWLKGLRFLFWEFQDFQWQHNHIQSPNNSEVLKIMIPLHLSSMFFLHKSEVLGNYHHFLILQAGLFTSCVGLSLHIFGKCVSYGCNSSHFPTRHEKIGM